MHRSEASKFAVGVYVVQIVPVVTVPFEVLFACLELLQLTSVAPHLLLLLRDVP
jgi:hypothetical protein